MPTRTRCANGRQGAGGSAHKDQVRAWWTRGRRQCSECPAGCALDSVLGVSAPLTTTCSHTHAHTPYTNTHTRTHMHARTHTHAHARTHALTRARTHRYTQMCARVFALCMLSVRAGQQWGLLCVCVCLACVVCASV